MYIGKNESRWTEVYLWQKAYVQVYTGEGKGQNDRRYRSSNYAIGSRQESPLFAIYEI